MGAVVVFIGVAAAIAEVAGQGRKGASRQRATKYVQCCHCIQYFNIGGDETHTGHMLDNKAISHLSDHIDP